MADKEVVDEPAAPRKETFRDFIWNSRDKTVLGRTGGSWVKITLFYCIFYACLAGWFAGLLHAFYSTLDETRPSYYGKDSLHRANPALGVRPMPIYYTTLIKFSTGRPSSAAPYVDHLRAFLNTYNDVGMDCPSNSSSAGQEQACSVDVTAILKESGCDTENFGYTEGKPCVAVKMNKLFGFIPEPYNSLDELKEDQELDELPENLSWASGNVGVACNGRNAIDRTHVKGMTFGPSNGIASKYFPYENQKGYRSPFILFKLDVEKRNIVQIECKIYDGNVDNSGSQLEIGTVNFEVFID